MALVNFSGAETGDLLEALGSIGSVSAQNTTARNGGFAYRCNPTGSASGTVSFGGVGASGTGTNASASDSYLRFYFYFAALPASAQTFLRIQDSSLFNKVTLALNPAGTLTTTDNAAATLTSSATLSAATWYRINVRCGTGASTNLTVSIDGVSAISSSTSGVSTNPAAQAVIGRVSGGTEAVDYYFDDFMWDDAAPPGAGQCVALLPSGPGNYTNGTPNGAATRWQCLTQTPNDGDVTYVNGVPNASAQSSAVAVGGVLVTSGALVKGVVVSKNDGGGTANVKALVRDGTTPFDQKTTGAIMTASYVAVQMLAPLTAAGAAWTNANLPGAEVGWFENSGNASRCTASLLMVDYLPQPPVATARRRQRQAAARAPSPVIVW